MWTWQQAAGRMTGPDGRVWRGYSGKGRGVNNPALQGLRGVGPIPAGRWRMLRVENSARVGPFSIVLDKVDARPGDDRDEVTGRDAFRIHGDRVNGPPQSASSGCIILPRIVREAIWRSGDRELEVVP